MRIYANPIAYHYKAFSILWDTKILGFQNRIIKFIFTPKIVCKVLNDFLTSVHHTLYILHEKKLWTNIPKEDKILFV